MVSLYLLVYDNAHILEFWWLWTTLPFSCQYTDDDGKIQIVKMISFHFYHMKMFLLINQYSNWWRDLLKYLRIVYCEIGFLLQKVRWIYMIYIISSKIYLKAFTIATGDPNPWHPTHHTAHIFAGNVYRIKYIRISVLSRLIWGYDMITFWKSYITQLHYTYRQYYQTAYTFP